MSGVIPFLVGMAQNPMFSGLIGGSVVGGLFYLLRGIPKKVGEWLLVLISREVCVVNDNYAYEWLERWMANHPYTKSRWCRNLSLRIMPTETVEHDDYEKIFAPGFSYHLMWYKGWPVVIDHWREEGGSATSWGRKQEGLRIRILFGSRAVAEAMVDEAEKMAKNIVGRIPTHLWVGGAWERAAPMRPRALETVHMRGGIVNNVVVDVDKFLGSQDWYNSMGIPYRRGYLFTGSPGTGKTTLAIALASYLMRPVYVVPLNNVGDTDLTAAVLSLPRNAVLLFEDIDTVAQSSQRVSEGAGKNTMDAPKLSLGGLLNAIDGVFASEGRILIMTTNHPERLDPALVRPGRVDKRVEFDLADSNVVAAMFSSAYGKTLSPLLFREVKSVSPAAVQGVLLTHRDDPKKALEALAA